MKFRTYPVALTADISKMYRAVQLAEAEEAISEYRNDSCYFWSSCLSLLGSQNLTADGTRLWCRLPSPHVTHSFYLDDLLAGADTPEEASVLQKELRALLLKGGFDLHK